MATNVKEVRLGFGVFLDSFYIQLSSTFGENYQNGNRYIWNKNGKYVKIWQEDCLKDVVVHEDSSVKEIKDRILQLAKQRTEYHCTLNNDDTRLVFDQMLIEDEATARGLDMVDGDNVALIKSSSPWVWEMIFPYTVGNNKTTQRHLDAH